ncbi:MAG: hypothetical protein HC802_15145 [Caldilineaceae bacterium]|nr:hypothetical protein [Caldilineaceae bacterium]
MAYSLNDPYRSLRLVMRIDGVLVGAGLGLLLTFLPNRSFASLGLAVAEPGWTARLAGLLLVTLGIYFFMAAEQSPPVLATLVALALANLAVALVLLTAYLQLELTGLTVLGQFLLVFLFAFCLMTALLSIRFMRSEARYL